MAKSRIPGPLERRHLVERELSPAQALRHAEAYLAAGRSVGGQAEDVLESRSFGQPEGAPSDVVGPRDLPFGHPAGSLVVGNLVCDRFKAIRRMAQKDHAEYGHEVLVVGEVGIRPELVRGFPEVLLEFADVLQHGVFNSSLS